LKKRKKHYACQKAEFRFDNDNMKKFINQTDESDVEIEKIEMIKKIDDNN